MLIESQISCDIVAFCGIFVLVFFVTYLPIPYLDLTNSFLGLEAWLIAIAPATCLYTCCTIFSWNLLEIASNIQFASNNISRFHVMLVSHPMIAREDSFAAFAACVSQWGVHYFVSG